MSAIANLAALLMSQGLSYDIVRQSLELVEEHATQVLDRNAAIVRQSYDSSYDRKKTYDRERQAELRKAKRQSYDSEKADILTSLSSSLLSEETLKKERKKESSGIRARDASAVPDDWPLNYGDLFWQAYPR